MKHFNYYRNTIFLLVVVICFLNQGCKKYLDVRGPANKLTVATAFGDDVTATSAIAGIYVEMANFSSFSGGSEYSVTGICVLSSDEMIDYYRFNAPVLDIEANSLKPDNSYIEQLWASAYKIIYQANAAIENLQASTGLSASVKEQLTGEALLIRAFAHFYLVNLFGDVPLVTTTNYVANAKIQRSSSSAVYEQIEDDLLKAKELLSENYVTSGRVRPNKSAVIALLARVYLYQQQWQQAETEATLVIDNDLYDLPDLDNAFLSSSSEAIWQVMPNTPDFNTWEGYYFVAYSLGPQSSVLRPDFINTFESNDQRATKWVGIYNDGISDNYFPYKFKEDIFSTVQREYPIMLRLGEQFLIRAEARANQDDLEGAIADMDKIRERAELPLLQNTNPGISKTDLLTAIQHERQVELFTEWGHRWFDLKRTGTAGDVLSPIKSDWSDDDTLYPIPEKELLKNSFLGDQNPGY